MTTTTERAAAAPAEASAGRLDRLKAVGVAAALGAGLVSAVQSHVNGSFTAYLNAGVGGPAPRNGVVVATIAFTSAALLLALVVAFTPRARKGMARVVASLRAGRKNAPDAIRAIHPGVAGIGRLRWFQVIGGAAGGLFVTAQSITVSSIGVAMFVVATTAGQSVSSLFCDRFGFAPGGRRAITIGRAIGPLLAVCAVVVARWGTFGNTSQLYLLVLPVAAGICVAAQHAVNGRVETTAAHAPFGPRVDRIPGALSATFVNFLVGTVALVVAAAVALAIQGLPTADFPGEWWMYTGGMLGVIFIGTAAAVVHRIGALLLALSLIAGQITGGLIIDALRGQDPAVNALVAVALTFCAIAVPALTSAPKKR